MDDTVAPRRGTAALKGSDTWLPRFPRRNIDIRNHGAVEGGEKMCTAAFDAAVRACAELGGGRVVVPAGRWLSGAIQLRSNVELRLSKGAIVRFSANPGDYLQCVRTRWGGHDCFAHSPFIYAHDCQNIAVTGEGTLLGDGGNWTVSKQQQSKMRAAIEKMAATAVPIAQRRFDSDELLLRPPMIGFLGCTQVLLDGITIAQAGPLRTIQLADCEQVTVRGLEVKAADNSASDGIHIDACSDVIVEECRISAGEDCIHIFAGERRESGDEAAVFNIVVRKVSALAGRCGISIESAGLKIRQVLVHDCRIDGVETGLRINAASGVDGSVQDVEVRDIWMGTISGDAIQLTGSGAPSARGNVEAPSLRNVQISQLTCKQASTAVRLTGLFTAPTPEISLQDLNINADQGLYCTASNGLRLANVRITPRSGPVLSLKDSRNVIIDGLNSVHRHCVFLDLRGRQVRDVRLRGSPGVRVRPVVVLGIDVPRDALIHE